MEKFTWIVLIIAVVLIIVIWVIKFITCHVYYYFAFNPEHNTPTKVAWIMTIIIAITSAFIIW